MKDDQPISFLNVGDLKAIMREVLEEKTPIPSTSTADIPEVFGIQEFMAFTNYTKNTVYKLVKEKKVPGHQPRPKGKIFFYRTEFINWVVQQEDQELQSFISPLLRHS